MTSWGSGAGEEMGDAVRGPGCGGAIPTTCLMGERKMLRRESRPWRGGGKGRRGQLRGWAGSVAPAGGRGGRWGPSLALFSGCGRKVQRPPRRNAGGKGNRAGGLRPPRPR